MNNVDFKKSEFTSLLAQKKAMINQPDIAETKDIDLGYGLPKTAERGQMNTPISALGGATLWDLSRLSVVVLLALLLVAAAFNHPSSSL